MSMVHNIHNVGDTPINNVSLYHMARMISHQPNICGQVFLLNTYLPNPTRIEELYVLGIINAKHRTATDDPRFSYSQSQSKWEWF